MNLLSLKKNHMVVSRGATAIYLILQTELLPDSKVLVPANICYAAIYPIIYAQCIPVFCDCDMETANVSYEIVRKYVDEVDAMILPHMLGNPIMDIEKIADMCLDKKVLLIEDCASAMGASVDEKLCGSFGDYSIFSTGYSKTIDLGFGGLIISDCDLRQLENEYNQLGCKSCYYDDDEAFFSKLYRLIRNDEKQQISQYVWAGLRDKLKDMFVHKDTSMDEEIINALESLDEVVEKRRRNYLIYEKNLNCKVIKINNYEGSVPWRFSICVNELIRRDLIGYLLERQVPVSDWYPNVTPIFGNRISFDNIDYLERRILNFPILIDEKEIIRICKLLNCYFSEKQ